MAIVIESSPAEAAWEASQQLPTIELARLCEMLKIVIVVEESSEWSDEDLRDFSNASFALFEQREAEEAAPVNQWAGAFHPASATAAGSQRLRD